MALPEWIEFVKAGGGICAPLLLIALLWMNNERKEAIQKWEASNAKLSDLSERTIVLFTEIKGIVGQIK